MADNDPRLRLLGELPQWQAALDGVEWTSDTKSQLESLVVAAHGLRPLLRTSAVIAYVTSPLVVEDNDARGELAQDVEYAREHVHQALSVETDAAVGIAHLHVAEALMRHVIESLERAVS